MPKIGWGTPRNARVRTISETSRQDSHHGSLASIDTTRRSPAPAMKDAGRKESLRMFSDAALLGRLCFNPFYIFLRCLIALKLPKHHFNITPLKAPAKTASEKNVYLSRL